MGKNILNIIKDRQWNNNIHTSQRRHSLIIVITINKLSIKNIQ